MQNKIKLFFIFLAIVAILSVLSFFDIMGGVKSALISDPVNPLPNPSDDDDHDGLLNADESYWNTDFQNPDSDNDGFLDGEEVASKHDPTRAGPDDALLTDNLTDKISNLAVAGLAEGSLNPDGANYDQSADSLALSVIDDGLVSFIPKLDVSKIKTTPSSKEIDQRYLEQLESSWDLFFKTLNAEIKEMEPKLFYIDGADSYESTQYFSTKRNEFNSIAQIWLAITVPDNFFEEHSDFLNIILGIAEINNALANGKEDPIRGAMAFNLFIKVLGENIPDTIKLYADKAGNENISTNLF